MLTQAESLVQKVGKKWSNIFFGGSFAKEWIPKRKTCSLRCLCISV